MVPGDYITIIINLIVFLYYIVRKYLRKKCECKTNKTAINTSETNKDIKIISHDIIPDVLDELKNIPEEINNVQILIKDLENIGEIDNIPDALNKAKIIIKDVENIF